MFTHTAVICLVNEAVGWNSAVSSWKLRGHGTGVASGFGQARIQATTPRCTNNANPHPPSGKRRSCTTCRRKVS
jgi:hypothetical protein